MQVVDFMTPAPVTIEPDTSIENALALMDEYAVRHLPVVEGDRLVGVLSNRDLLGLSGWKMLGPTDAEDDSPRTVAEVMHQDVVTIDPSDEVVAAAVEVSVGAIGCLPVVEGDRLVGIVSEMDLIRLVSEGASLAKSWAGAIPTVGAMGAPKAVTVEPTVTLAEIDELMNAKSIRHVPVMDGMRLLGIVSDRDMRRAMGAGLRLDTPASEIMTEGVVTVPGDASLVQAAQAMSDRRISALVVTAESGDLGIVTTTDILDYALNSL